MKLLILFPSSGRGGAEEYALTIAKAAISQGWETHVAFHNTLQTASLIQDFQISQIQYHALKIKESSDPKNESLLAHGLRFFKTLVLLWKLKPDAVHIVLPSQNLGKASLLACSVLKFPTLVVFQLAPYRLPISPKMQRLYAWAKARNQQWVAVSEHNRQVVSKTFNFAKDEIACIYNGADFKLDSQHKKGEEIERALVPSSLTM
jgi:glycosyltransferase involved in cell wall biosynthesis